MARFPEAEWLGEHSPESPMDRYDVVCVHTIVGYAPAHAAHFSVHGSGKIQQSRDTKFKSAANLYGNHRVIAVENEDHGPEFPSWNTRDGHAVPALTDAQVTANAKILAWAHTEHGVPLQLNPNSKPGSRGLGYHRQGCDGQFGSYDYPGRVSGGELWSKAYGKVCPGDRRIDQLPEILRRAEAIVGGIDPEDEEMALRRSRESSLDVMELQETLNHAAKYGPWDIKPGWYPLTVDGIYLDETSKAVAQFKKLVFWNHGPWGGRAPFGFIARLEAYIRDKSKESA